jgi:hypothetical protein
MNRVDGQRTSRASDKSLREARHLAGGVAAACFRASYLGGK